MTKGEFHWSIRTPFFAPLLRRPDQMAGPIHNVMAISMPHRPIVICHYNLHAHPKSTQEACVSIHKTESCSKLTRKT